MGTYIVEIGWPRCGKTHRVPNHFRLDGGPTMPGCLADLYGKAELPQALGRLPDDLAWCEVTERCVNGKDRRRVQGGPLAP